MELKSGDKVRVVLPGQRMHNHVGTIVMPPTDTGRMVVEFTEGDAWFLYPDEVVKVEKD
jgi:hypothetical protein